MVDKPMEFDQRVRRLNKKHQAMSRGYFARMRSDGLIVMKPHRVRSALPLRVLVMFGVAFFVFKAFLLAALGHASYSDRVERLSEGTSVEKAGAWVMQVEPITELIATQLGSILR